MIPLVICLSLIIGACSIFAIRVINFEGDFGLFPFLLTPFYQYFWYGRVFTNMFLIIMLSCIRIALFISLTGYVLSKAVQVYELVTQDVYFLVEHLIIITTWQGSKLDLNFYGSSILFGIGSTVVVVLFLEFMISQSPDKMKGLIIGISIPFLYTNLLFMQLIDFKLCLDILTVASIVLLFVVFLILSKRYTLRERNREINILAIVEEHYKRYMDQEEEYMRENSHHFSVLS